jgi:hypothetical protein
MPIAREFIFRRLAKEANMNAGIPLMPALEPLTILILPLNTHKEINYR